jgi:divalent metal cation (Fe/Co/Zn/Cd) transporter
MDASLPAEDLAALQSAIAPYIKDRIEFHAIRTRQAASRQFVSMHVLVPGDWTVHRGHELLERLERDVRNVLPRATVLTHMESLDDPASWHDIDLDRGVE